MALPRRLWPGRRVIGKGPPEHLSLDGLTVPTVVVGSQKDRLLPIGLSRLRSPTPRQNLVAVVVTARRV